MEEAGKQEGERRLETQEKKHNDIGKPEPSGRASIVPAIPLPEEPQRVGEQPAKKGKASSKSSSLASAPTCFIGSNPAGVTAIM